MKTRIISGLIMVPLLTVLYLGGIWLWLACVIISLMGVHEFCKGWNNIDVKPSRFICIIMTIALFTPNMNPSLSFGNYNDLPRYYTAMVDVCIWLFMVIIITMIYGWKINERGTYDAISTIATLVYIPFFVFHMVLIDMTEYRLLIWIVVISAFGQDICAYFTGYFLGKHKMAPNLSPKKTIEGAIGGLIGSTLLSFAFGLVFMKNSGLDNAPLICAVLGFVGGAAGMAGDLTASAFKRKMGIKDYGTLIPGHGGIMDRFDSVIFTAPVIYYAICVISGIVPNIATHI